MTETKKRGRPRKEEAEMRELDEQIRGLEAEQGDLEDTAGRALTWAEITSTTPDELARREQRRGILPRLIHAAKVRRQELEVSRREREADEKRESLEPLYEAFQAKEEELREAKERRDKAHGEWTLTLSAVQSADDRTKRARKELEELRAAGR